MNNKTNIPYQQSVLKGNHKLDSAILFPKTSQSSQNDSEGMVFQIIRETCQFSNKCLTIFQYMVNGKPPASCYKMYQQAMPNNTH